MEAWSTILDIVYDLAKKKPWLRDECGFILFKSIRTMKGKDVKYAQLLIDKLLAKGLSKTAQGVAIWIGIQAEFPSIDLPHGVWRHEDPLNRKETSRLAKILMEAPAATSPEISLELETTTKGAWTTKLQFAWDVILPVLMGVQPQGLQKNKRLTKRVKFGDFWKECIDSKLFQVQKNSMLRKSDTLFAASSSEERKYSGFLLFQQMTPIVPVHLLPDIFTKNLMRCLINQLASQERYLHRAAERSIKALIARARLDPNARAPILKAVLDPDKGDINFDKITKTKTVEFLISSVDDPAYEQLTDVYEDLILRPGVEDEKAAMSRRQSAADQLVSAIKSIQQPTGEDLAKSQCLVSIRRILAVLAKYAYFDVDNVQDNRGLNPSPKMSQASREMFRSRIMSCLSSLIAKPIGQPSHFAYELVFGIHGREEKTDYPSAVLNADENVRSVLKAAWQILRKVHSQSSLIPDVEARFYRALELLYSLTIIQVHNEEADAVGILVELNDSFSSLLHKKKPPRDSATLVEILLSFIAKPSQLFRRLAQQVFTACASELDNSALQSMIKVSNSIFCENQNTKHRRFWRRRRLYQARLKCLTKKTKTGQWDRCPTWKKSKQQTLGQEALPPRKNPMKDPATQMQWTQMGMVMNWQHSTQNLHKLWALGLATKI